MVAGCVWVGHIGGEGFVVHQGARAHAAAKRRGERLGAACEEKKKKGVRRKGKNESKKDWIHTEQTRVVRRQGHLRGGAREVGRLIEKIQTRKNTNTEK